MKNKIIWMCWFQGENSPNISKLTKECIKRWRNLNPDWEVNVLSNDTIKKYIPEYFDIVKNSPERKYPARSDLLRILLLSKYGGVWTDVSVYPMLPLSRFYNKIVNETGFFTYRCIRHKQTVSWFLCVNEPKHYLIEKWKEVFINSYKTLDPWIYFTFHGDLSKLYGNDVKIKKIIDNMVQINQQAPHSATKDTQSKKIMPSFVYKKPRCTELLIPPTL